MYAYAGGAWSLGVGAAAGWTNRVAYHDAADSAASIEELLRPEPIAALIGDVRELFGGHCGASALRGRSPPAPAHYIQQSLQRTG